MKLKDTIKKMMLLFCVINTALFTTTAVTGILMDIEIVMNTSAILHYILISLSSVLPMLIFLGQESASRGKEIVIRALHFILTAGAVFGLMVYYGIINAANALFVVLVFLVIYAAAYTVLAVRDRKLADKLNERISAFNSAESGEEP
ncbi:MAG: DUF3021 domain-containing protein [Defluviitaleaceae bacterium]|nr:DUF3021 domain-containing protein [Defluviitaleaceae bacterium]MCL2836772.1 DUF3021 domain-containing protein [Defluviitaleaceae bacterium]